MNEKIVLVEYAKPKGHPFVWAGASVGIIAGFLYFFLRGREGLGGRSSGGAGTGLPASPAIPKDQVRLTFVMVSPTADDPSHPSSFRGSDGKMFLLEEMIARVKAGGRSDVALKIRGDVRSGSAASAKVRVVEAGIKIWDDLATIGRSLERGCYQ